MRQPLFSQPSQIQQSHLAAHQLESEKTLVIQGLPLVGKRQFLASLSLAQNFQLRFFSVDPVRQSMLPKPVPSWLRGGGGPSAAPVLSVIAGSQLLPDFLLWQKARALVEDEPDRLVLLSTRELDCPVEQCSTFTLRPLTLPEAAAAACLQAGERVSMSSSDWLALARHLGGIPGLLAFACKQLSQCSLQVAIEAIQTQIQEWSQAVCDSLPETAQRCRLILSHLPFPLAKDEVILKLREAGCLPGLTILRSYFLLETDGPGISLLPPLRDRPSPVSVIHRPSGPIPQASQDGQARQCRRLWQLAFGVVPGDTLGEAEMELRNGNWSEARRLYHEAHLLGDADGWGGFVLTSLLLGQLPQAAQALAKSGPWRLSQRYPQPALLALAAYCHGEPAHGWQYLQQLTRPWNWMIHGLAALIHEGLVEYPLGQRSLSQFYPQDRLQQGWLLWLEGKLWLGSNDWKSAQSSWDAALQIFAEEGHPNGMLTVQAERLQLPVNLQVRVTQQALQSWIALAEQQHNVGVKTRLQLVLAIWYPRPDQTAPNFAHAWLQSRHRLNGPHTPPEVPLSVKCFGQLRLTGPLGECHESDWPTRKAANLFYLICHARRPVGDEYLMATLWPNANQEQGRTRLRTALHHVRLSLEKIGGKSAAEGIQRSRKNRTIAMTYAFESDFQQLKGLLQSTRTSPLLNSCAHIWDFVEAHVERVFLPTFRDEWTDPIRRDVAAWWCELLNFLGRSELAQQRPQLADRAAQMGLDMDEFKEDLIELRLQALQAQGLVFEAALWAASKGKAYREEFGHLPASLAAYQP
ncbi:hypothetical protein IV102_29995 [bacterium]|nr:hypothetical protein [bacterium]